MPLGRLFHQIADNAAFEILQGEDFDFQFRHQKVIAREQFLGKFAQMDNLNIPIWLYWWPEQSDSGRCKTQSLHREYYR